MVSFLNNCIENFSKYIYIIAKKIYFKNRFQYPYSFQYQSNIIRVIQIKKKRINFLFIAVLYFPLSIQMNILTLYNNCYVILTTYMLDSALEPLYNLSKNLLLLPWILKSMVDMVNDSTPPTKSFFFVGDEQKHECNFITLPCLYNICLSNLK